MKAHPTAIVDPAAEVAADVEIGPFCVVGPGVRIDSGCRLLARVTIHGPAALGRGNVLHPNVVIGTSSQQLDVTPPAGRIEIGDDNVLREGVTVSFPADPKGLTKIGSRNRFYPSSQVGHDCVIGDGTLVGSGAALAGHTTLHDEAFIEGAGGTNAGVIVGRGGWVQSHSMCSTHVAPYMGVGGDRTEVRAINPRFRTPALESAFQVLWRSKLPLEEALQKLSGDADPRVAELVEFLRRPPLEAPV